MLACCVLENVNQVIKLGKKNIKFWLSSGPEKLFQLGVTVKLSFRASEKLY